MSVKIKLTLPSGHQEEMTPDEARGLLAQLRAALSETAPNEWRERDLQNPVPADWHDVAEAIAQAVVAGAVARRHAWPA